MFLKKRFTAAFALMAIAAFVFYVNLAEAQNFVTKGLVSFWTFDQSDIVGNTLKDVWGKNDGTIEGGPKVVKGRIGEALEFDGEDDCIKVPHDSSIDFPDGPFSIELWFKGNADTIGEHRIVRKGFAAGFGKRYEFFITSGAEVDFTVDDDVTKTRVVYAAGIDEMSDESWHHWVCVRDIDKGKLRIYLDAEEVANCDDVSKNSISSETPLWFATHDPDDADGQGKGKCPGIIDELRIFSRALSKEAIQQNYNVTTHAVFPAFKLAALWGQIKSLR